MNKSLPNKILSSAFDLTTEQSADQNDIQDVDTEESYGDDEDTASQEITDLLEPQFCKFSTIRETATWMKTGQFLVNK